MMMDTNIMTQSVSNPYWVMLKGLSDDVKIELITLLRESLIDKPSAREEKHWADRFSGAWQDSRSAEEIMDDIYSSRTAQKENSKMSKSCCFLYSSEKPPALREAAESFSPAFFQKG